MTRAVSVSRKYVPSEKPAAGYFLRYKLVHGMPAHASAFKRLGRLIKLPRSRAVSAMRSQVTRVTTCYVPKRLAQSHVRASRGLAYVYITTTSDRYYVKNIFVTLNELVPAVFLGDLTQL